eukprot:8958653-Heterocapsa_arctica.AAC.1
MPAIDDVDVPRERARDLVRERLQPQERLRDLLIVDEAVKHAPAALLDGRPQLPGEWTQLRQQAAHP